MLRLLRSYPLSLLCVATIWLLCMAKPPSLPEGPEIPFADKIVHTLMYFGLCSLLWFEHLRSSPSVRWRHFLPLGIVAPIMMSGVIELAQAYLTTTRSGDWWDFLANTVGVVLAIPFGLWVIRPVARRLFHRNKQSI